MFASRGIGIHRPRSPGRLRVWLHRQSRLELATLDMMSSVLEVHSLKDCDDYLFAMLPHDTALRRGGTVV